MNTELISTAVARRLTEVRERMQRLDPPTYGDLHFFVTSTKKELLEQRNGISQLARFSQPEEWAEADTDCLTSLRTLALHGPKTMARAPHPSLDEFLNRLEVKTASREPVFELLAERYAWPLNFSFHPEDRVREHLLMRLMTADRKRIESKSTTAVNTDDLLLKLNLIAVYASTTTDLRFLDALNYYYELLPADWHPESAHAWLLVSWLALYARALNSWS